MKQVLLSGVMLFLMHFNPFAQLILLQDFSDGTAPGWYFSNGASIGSYENADADCAQEFGIITPGVGGNNPARVLSQVITPGQQIAEVKFSTQRYDANLGCDSRSNFACPTTVDILIVGSSYTGTDPVGDGAAIYANYSGYLLPVAGGFSSLLVTLPASMPEFRVFFNFRTENCVQPGTKYVLDKFSFTGFTPCQVSGTCPPVANNDYFNSIKQGFHDGTLLANVYGTNLAYTPPPGHSTCVTRSLTNDILSPLGGNDYDIDDHPLLDMTFSLLTQSFTGADATFTFNSDGTFSFTRLNNSITIFTFTYRLTDPDGNFDDATVTIDYGSLTPATIAWFRAVKNDRGVLLSWQTETEVLNRGFNVERSYDGSSFISIGFVPSQAPGGNSSSTLYYSFEDNARPAGNHVYYRLKQTDVTGKTRYSEIRLVKTDAAAMVITLFPNPSNGTVNILLPGDAGVADVIISTMQGAVIKQIHQTSERRFVFTGLQTGIYNIRVINKLTGQESSRRLAVL